MRGNGLREKGGISSIPTFDKIVIYGGEDCSQRVIYNVYNGQVIVKGDVKHNTVIIIRSQKDHSY